MRFSINCKGQLIDLSQPKIMGILNVTPDSFYDGGRLKSDTDIIKKVGKMLEEGATFIDVGGYSSRPNAKHINESEEEKRVLPVIELLVQEFPDILISVDTFRSEVAKHAITSGASMVNDISGGSIDNKMFETVAKLKVPYILMHMQGTPQNMQQNPVYKDVVHNLIFYFSKKIAQLCTLGMSDIILDVGFGFGKTLEHNYQLLKYLNLFKNLEVPILTGISRKSMLWKLLETSPEMALNATTVANTLALMKGTHILRVHDVKEAMEAVKITSFLKSVE